VAAVPYAGPDLKNEKVPKGAVPLSLQPFVGPLKYQMMVMWLRGLAAATGGC
jgi:hypothetical protein